MRHLIVEFGPVDVRNPDAGYQLRIQRADNGESLLWTGQDPATGYALRTPADCLAVAAMYAFNEEKASC